MGKTSAERQAAYRKRHSVSSGGDYYRLNTPIHFTAKAALERLAAFYGLGQASTLERVLEEAENAILSDLSEEQVDAYREGSLRSSDAYEEGE